MKTRCLLVDDEPLAIEVLKSHIEKMESFEIADSCQNALQAFDILTKKKIDLIFLDIQMPGMKGTEFLKNLKNPPKVILTTAYREYALEGYELDVVDYILKPISFERFFKAVNKYLQTNNNEIIIHRNEKGNVNESYIYVRANKKINKIMLSDILYIESIKDYLTIHSKTRKVTAKHTITSLEEKLPESEFVRIHRSYVVALKQITGFTANTIEIDDKELPIGRNFRQTVFKALNYNLPDE
ncbi:MAG TPA: LytTR family DNA-binding domain-containing protein [Bacteroidales bacterium]